MTTLHLHGGQEAVARLRDQSETLLAGEPGSGVSYALRVGALALAWRQKGARVLLAGPREQEVRRHHVEGPNGLLAMLGEGTRRGVVHLAGSEARLSNGSVLAWTGLDSPAELDRAVEFAPSAVFLDDADEVPEHAWDRLQQRVMISPANVRAAIAGTTAPARLPWRERFNGGVVELRRGDLPEELQQITPPRGIREFADVVRPGVRWFPHVLSAASAVQGLADGVHENVAVLMPPQHGKTLIGPQLGGSYLLERHPTRWAAIVCYGASEAANRSFAAREFYEKAGHRIKAGRGSASNWMTVYGGGMWSAGIGGAQTAQTGRPMSYGIIDDPDKNLQESLSAAAQRQKRDWYTTVWRARESMFGGTPLRQLLIATRWHTEDTTSFILRTAALAEERWHIVLLSATFDPDVRAQFTDERVARDTFGDEAGERIPELFELADDWRTKPGEPIAPELRDVAGWKKQKRLVGPLHYAAVWQQNPIPGEGGGVFKGEQIRIVSSLEELAEQLGVEISVVDRCRSWDDGATEDGGDATVGLRMLRLSSDHYAIDHVIEKHIDGPKVKPLKVRTAKLDGPAVTVTTPKDPGAAGKTDAAETVRQLREARVWRVEAVGRTGSKSVHARPLASIARADEDEGEEFGLLVLIADAQGMVGEVPADRIVRVLHNFRGEDGQEDDIVDAAADAYNHLSGRGGASAQIY